MADYYGDLEMRMRDMVNDVKDALDRPNDSAARRLLQDVQKAEDMAQVSRPLRSIEDVVESLMNQLKQSQGASNGQHIISPNDANKFYGQLEQIRNQIRRQPNY